MIIKYLIIFVMTFCVGFDWISFDFGCFLILAFLLLAIYWRNFAKKRNSKCEKESEFFSFQSPEVRKNRSNRQFLYLVFIG